MADGSTMASFATAGGTLVLAAATVVSMRSHGWTFHPERVVREQPGLRGEDVVRLTRDIDVPPGDVGFWQGACREPSSPDFAAARAAIESRGGMTIDRLYGDDPREAQGRG